jgi:hypothetical protein
LKAPPGGSESRSPLSPELFAYHSEREQSSDSDGLPDTNGAIHSSFGIDDWKIHTGIRLSLLKERTDVYSQNLLTRVRFGKCDCDP